MKYSYYLTMLVFVASVFIQTSLEARPPLTSNTGTVIQNQITVNSTLDELNNGDGNCTLREAITNVNDGARTYTDCSAPSRLNILNPTTVRLTVE